MREREREIDRAHEADRLNGRHHGRSVIREHDTEHPQSIEGLAADLAAYERRSDLAREHYQAATMREAAQARLDRLDGASERAMLADIAFRRAMSGVYRDPESAREAFLERTKKRGAAEAVIGLRNKPERYGDLATVRQSIVFGLMHRDDVRPAREAALEAAARARDALDAEHKLHELARSTSRQRIEAERAHDLTVVQHFTRELGELYRDPARAHVELEQAARERGIEYATESMRRHPWLYGELKETSFDERALRHSIERIARLAPEAVRAARDLPEIEARLAREAGSMARRPDVASERQQCVQSLAGAVRRERDVAGEVAQLPETKVLERRISENLQRLSPDGFRRLERVASPAQILLATKLRDAARQVAFGQELGQGD